MKELDRYIKPTKASYTLAAIIITVYGCGLVSKWVVLDEVQWMGTHSGLLLVLVIIFACLIAYPVSIVIEAIWHSIDSDDCDAMIADREICWDFPKDRPLHIRRLLVEAIFLLIAWVPYIIVRFPGNADVDTFWQLLQIYGYIPMNDHHPFFDTLVFGAFWRIGDAIGTHAISLALYCIIQMAITALVLSYIVEYSSSRGVPAFVSKGMIAFYALYPAVPMFAQTMAKDMLHGWVFALLTVLFYELVLTKGGAIKDNRFVILMVFVITMAILTKKSGVYVVVLSLIILVCWLLISNRQLIPRLLVILLMPIIIYKGFFILAGTKWDIQPSEQAEKLSVPSQQTAYIIKKHVKDITSEEWSVLNGVYADAKTLGDIYVPERADAAKGRWNNDSGSGEKAAYLKWYRRQYIKHPVQMFEAVMALDYPLVCVDTDSQGDESLVFYRDEVPCKDNALRVEEWLAGMSNGNATIEDMHNLFYTAYRSDVEVKLSSTFDRFLIHIMHTVAVLFSKCLIATWIPLFSLFYKAKNLGTSGFMMDLLVILNILVLATGPIVLPRYMVISVYTDPLLIAGMYFTGKGRRPNG